MYLYASLKAQFQLSSELLRLSPSVSLLNVLERGLDGMTRSDARELNR